MIIFIITNINSAGCVAVAQAVEAAARAELLQVRHRSGPWSDIATGYGSTIQQQEEGNGCDCGSQSLQLRPAILRLLIEIRNVTETATIAAL